MKVKALVLSVTMAICACFGVAQSASAVTCPPGSVHQGEANSYAECNLPDDVKEDEPLMDTVVRIINIVVGVVGVISVASIVIGGIYFVISLGDSAKITRAKNAVLYGVVGVVIAVLAFAIVNFVLTTVFSKGGGGGGGNPGGNKDSSSNVEDSAGSGEAIK